MTPNLDLLRKLFSYDKWALKLSSDSIEKASNAEAQLMLSHILIAEKIWMLRLKGEETSHIPTFGEISPEECIKMADKLHHQYMEFLNSLSEADLDSPIIYKNSKGIEFQTPVKDVLLHVAIHGAYHRGQIAWLIRAGGAEAVNTDYIGFTRI